MPNINGERFLFAFCGQLITSHRDRRKLTFYFIADKRIDFRELVRELFRYVSLRPNRFVRSNKICLVCTRQESGWHHCKGHRNKPSVLSGIRYAKIYFHHDSLTIYVCFNSCTIYRVALSLLSQFSHMAPLPFQSFYYIFLLSALVFSRTFSVHFESRFVTHSVSVMQRYI
jgi:hypothetical protein